MPNFRWTLYLVWLCTVAIHSAAEASEHQKFYIADALGSVDAQGKLDGTVRFYWGPQPYPKPTHEFGSFTAIKNASMVRRAGPSACKWGLLSALIFLQNLAKEHGGNAVVGIRSAWLDADLSSQSEYGCDVGSFKTRVILHAKIVTLP